jgi:hypothetical protein
MKESSVLDNANIVARQTRRSRQVPRQLRDSHAMIEGLPIFDFHHGHDAFGDIK